MTSRRVCTNPLTLLLVAIYSVCLFFGLAGCALTSVSSNAEASDVGLPLYPNSIKATPNNDDKAGMRFAMWGGAIGIKLAAVSYVTMDSLEPVARFYYDALSKYGPVLDCSSEKAPATEARSSLVPASIDGEAPLECRNDLVTVGGRVFKVGNQHDQRVVSIQSEGAGVSFKLMHLEMRDHH